MSNIVARTITGVVFVVLLISAIVLSKFVFSALFLLITILGLWEFFSMVEKVQIFPNKIAGTLAGAFLFISNALVALEIAPFGILLFNFVFIFIIFLLELYRRIENPFTNVAFTFFGIIYVALPFSILNYLPNPGFVSHHYNYSILLGFFFLVWINESGAYLVGTAIGRNKLFERISPKKTWEGTIGGGVLCLTTAWIIGRYYHDISSLNWIVVAAIVVVFSTYGDLFESLLKRSVKTKDSGSLLPGHGGILDRFDGVLMATPFVWVYLFWIT